MKFSLVICFLLVVQFSFSQEKFTVLSPEQYAQKLEEIPDHQIVDVRTSIEHNRSHMHEAQNISFLWFSFTEQANKLDRDKPIFLYCQTAHRSPFAARKLHSMGFTQIYDLEGGFKAWEEKGFPVEK